MSRTKSLTAAGIAVVGMALVLGACTSPGTPSAGSTTGSSATSTPPTAAPPSTATTGAGGTSEAPPSTAGGPNRCSPAVLSGTIRQKDSAAGNRYAELVVTNTGSAPCTLYGYGGLQLIGQDGNPLHTTALRAEAPKPALVVVTPGGHAAKLLHWTVVPTGGEPQTGPCQPDPAKLSIIPPDETQPFVVPWDLGPACGQGTIHGSAYYKA